MPPKKKSKKSAKQRKAQQKKERQKKRKVQERDTSKINQINRDARNLGYRGKQVFKTDGSLDTSYKKWLVRNYQKGNSPNYDNTSIRVAENINDFLPSGYTFNPLSNNIILERGATDKKGRIFKKFDRAGLKIENRKLVPKTEPNRNVSGTIKFRTITRYRTKTGGTTRGYQQNIEELFDIPYSQNWKETLKEDIRQRYDMESPFTRVIFDKIEGSRFKFNQEEGAVMADIKMRLIGLRLDGHREHEWDKQEGKCTVDFLRFYYKKDVEEGKMKEEYLSDEAFDEVFDEGWKENGVSARELLKGWCCAMNIRGLALNKNKEIITKYDPDESGHFKTLVFIVHNNHIHPITDTNTIKSLAQSFSTKTDAFQINNKKFKEKKKLENEEKMKNITVEYITPTEDLGNWKFMMIEMLKNKTETLNENIEMKGGRLFSFILGNKKYVFEDDKNKAISDWYEERGLKYDGIPASIIVKECMEQLDILKSTPSTIVNKLLLLEGMKDRTHLGGDMPFTKDGDIDTTGIKSFDINKCHTSILREPREEWIILKRHDYLLQYNNEKINLGLYYITPPNDDFFTGNNFYASAETKYALSKNYITKDDIKYYIPCSSPLNKNYFKRLIKKYEDLTGNKTEVEKAFNKLLNNMTSGMLGKTQVKLQKQNISQDINEVWNYYIENQDSGKESFHSPYTLDYEGQEYKFCIFGNKNTINKAEHNLPIFMQIYGQQLIKLDEIKQRMGGEIMYRKVDTIMLKGVREDYKKYLSDEIGGIREEEPPEEPKLYRQRKCKLGLKNFEKFLKSSDMKYLHYDKEWHFNKSIKTSSTCTEKLMMLYNQNQGCLIEGDAGCGKSFIIHQLRSKFKEEEIITLAPTNISALNINGKTFHRAFGLSREEDKDILKMSLKRMETLQKTKIIIVDEASMVNGECWNILALIKENYKIPIYMFGNFHRQNLPVDLDNPNYCWMNHPLLKKLADYNYGVLQYDPTVGRYDNELREFSLKYEEPDLFKKGMTILRGRGQSDRRLDVNICFTNKTRKAVNHSRMMHYHLNKDTATTHFIDPKNFGTVWDDKVESLNNTGGLEDFLNEKVEQYTEPDGDTDFRQPTSFRVGMPVIGMKNSNKFNVMNSERFTIIGMEGNDDERRIIKRFSIKLKLQSLLVKDKIIEIDMMDWFKLFAPAYCMTGHKMQGQGIDEPFFIHDTSNEHIDRRWIYTAITRATKLKWINV